MTRPAVLPTARLRGVGRDGHAQVAVSLLRARRGPFSLFALQNIPEHMTTTVYRLCRPSMLAHPVLQDHLAQGENV